MDTQAAVPRSGGAGVSANAPRPRVNNACEACRAAKVKCQPSVQTGICRRCLDFKRECVFRTGPRTRRPRMSRLNNNQDAPRLPPPPGPSKTFSINFDMPAPAEPSPRVFESLASRHESYIDSLLPPEDSPHTPMFDNLMFQALSSYHSPGGINLTPPHSHDSHQSPHSPHSSSSSSSTHGHHHHHHHNQHHQGNDGISSGTSHHGNSQHVPHHHQGTGAMSKASSAYSSVVSIANLGMKPQFNLDSASKLLAAFKDMLPHFPCIVLPEDADVHSLAKSKPFVLLAILSVASGAGSLQGHTLYDEEFRKILGLKFVAGGERSVELLQGLLIYTAWYPFHLRPKNKQALQYIRMAAEIAHDLELVHPPPEPVTPDSPITLEQIEGMRTYLCCYYLVSSFLTTWSKVAVLGIEYTHWTETCCDVLERRSGKEGDQTLSWLVRCAHTIEETVKADRSCNGDDEKDVQHTRLVLMGLEAQFQEWKSRVPAHMLPAGHALSIAISFAEIYLYVHPLLRYGTTNPGTASSHTGRRGAKPPPPEPARLARAIPLLRRMLDAIASLPAYAFVPLSATDWGKLIQFCIVALRLSFPLPECPGWDDECGRNTIQFGAFLDKFARNSEQGTSRDDHSSSSSSGKMNVLSASGIIFGIVKTKYDKRLAKLKEQQMMATPSDSSNRSLNRVGGGVGAGGGRSASGCPIFDASMEPWLRAWDPELQSQGGGIGIGWVDEPLLSAAMTHQPLEGDMEATMDNGVSFGEGQDDFGGGLMNTTSPAFDGGVGQPTLFHDVWATMTSAWSGEEGGGMAGDGGYHGTTNEDGDDDGTQAVQGGCPVMHQHTHAEGQHHL